MKRSVLRTAGALAVVGVAAAGVLVAGIGGGGDKDPPEGPAPSEVGAGTTTAPADDALCIAYDELVAAVGAIGAVDGPADFEALVAAQLAFHSGAAGREAEPEASAFRARADYWDQVQAFYGARGWEQQVDVADAALVPSPPPDETAAILAARCGVPAPVDNAP